MAWALSRTSKGKPSNKLVGQALEILENMEHRGAVGCEPDSGDGCGILTGTPDKFFRRECAKLGFKLPKAGEYAVAMCFLPQDLVSRQLCEARSWKRSSTNTAWCCSAGATCR